jgi:nucleoside-diphosphate-sugar epimerase
MRLLILGGTSFLGPHLVGAALARDHQVTTFNRGQHEHELPAGVERLRGNRDGELDALRGRSWDAVIDTSGYVPRVVRASAAYLRDAVGHYTFISTISVYKSLPQAGMDETAAVGTLDYESVEEVTGEAYGPLKALCEAAVEETVPGRALVIRPGLIVGPLDPTDRFTYWPYRVAQGGEVLAPGSPHEPVQFIDARDLAAWTVAMTERGAIGAYNATGPAAPLSMGTLLEVCREVSGSDARLTWVDEDFVLKAGLEPWTELPLWIPASEAEMAGHNAVSIARALQAGLTFRPLAATVRDTLAWDATRPTHHEWRAGLPREREAAVLAAWHRERVGE